MTGLTAADVEARVDRAFEDLRRDLTDWPDPHPMGVSPAVEEYSRITRPERYLLLGARVDAWLSTIVEEGVAVIDELAADAAIWDSEAHPLTPRSRLQRVDALERDDTQPLLISRQRRELVDDVFLAFGIGAPARQVSVVPFCGCDACDDGSQVLIEQIDNVFGHVLFGDRLEGLNSEVRLPVGQPWIGLRDRTG